jgi:hypothetical protein
MLTTLIITALMMTASPFALEQLNRLTSAAESWTRVQVLQSVLAASASERETQSVAPVAPVANQDFRWSGRIAEGRVIEIKGILGDVHAEPSAGNEVEVTATKRGSKSDPAGVEVRVLEHAGGVTICAIYPSSNPGRPNGCQAGDNWESHVSNNDVRVNFTVRVPRGVRFNGRTVNGDIETGRLDSDVDASTVNGSIHIAAAGVAHAMTVNGSITASMGNGAWTSPLEFKTVNGAITLDLPADTNAEVRAQTMNGDIYSDFPLTLTGRISRRQMNGTIGGGGRDLSLKTVNGDIRLRRLS